jgi:hypothetical protein
MKTIQSFAVLIFGLSTLGVNAQNKLTIECKPEHPLKEKINEQQYSLNFDFVIENQSTDSLKLTRLEISAFDRQNKLIQQKFLDNNGTAPSINTIPNIEWNSVSRRMLFNPFPDQNSITDKLEYTFVFNDSIEIKKVVIPTDYNQKTDFILPLKNKILVYDGHDFYSHHRRFDYEFAPIKQLGFTGNFMRYAYDFVVVDSEGKKFLSKGENDTDWFGFGTDVLAVADGEIVAIETNKKDDKTFDIPSLKDNPLTLYGNYIVIKHGEHLYSIYGHLKNKSAIGMKVGDKVKKGQKIASIGTSGSSFFPHLHFEVRNSINHQAEGLPSYFKNYYLILGSNKKEVTTHTITTGDIIQSK